MSAGTAENKSGLRGHYAPDLSRSARKDIRGVVAQLTSGIDKVGYENQARQGDIVVFGNNPEGITTVVIRANGLAPQAQIDRSRDTGQPEHSLVDDIALELDYSARIGGRPIRTLRTGAGVNPNPDTTQRLLGPEPKVLATFRMTPATTHDFDGTTGILNINYTTPPRGTRTTELNELVVVEVKPDNKASGVQVFGAHDLFKSVAAEIDLGRNILRLQPDWKFSRILAETPMDQLPKAGSLSTEQVIRDFLLERR